MKLRIAAPAPERTAEELTLVNRFAEYQTFLVRLPASSAYSLDLYC